MTKSPDSLIKKLGVEFKDKTLLDIALLHRSYSSEHQIARDNERLEYLGDSILSACVSDMLFRKFPEKSEGDLTKIRARLVSRRALKKWGKKLKLGDYVFLGEKMKKYMESRETHIIENTMEAVIGAIYIDSGFDTAYNFIKKGVENQDFHKIVDFKSQLQEYAVEVYGEIPQYTTISETGPSHNKKFKITVSVEDKIYGEGAGSNKKMAQQNAARKAYRKIKKRMRNNEE